MTLSEDVKDVVNKMTGTLPPAFMALLVVNMVFVIGLLYFVHSTAEVRARIDTARMAHIESIVSACVAKNSQ